VTTGHAAGEHGDADEHAASEHGDPQQEVLRVVVTATATPPTPVA